MDLSPSRRPGTALRTQEQDAAHVVVAVRTRPLNARELAASESDGSTLSYPGPQRLTLSHKGEDHAFIFDHVFGSESKQAQIFGDLGDQCLDQAFGGYNSTIFAYGQTGSGKTHTMMNHGAQEEEWGLVPRISADLFRRIDELTAANGNRRFLVQCSFLEIYNEVVQDLLIAKGRQQKGGGLEIKEAKGIGIYVKDLTEVVVEDAARLGQLIRDGFAYRSTAATKMNDRSSRSHCVFTVKLHQKDASDSSKNTISKVNLVDLAGSERAKATGAEGVRLKEGANINKSLSALGNVINALSTMESGKKKVFVPYRDSKLTRVLQESLGGNCLCTMIATLSPAPSSAEETLSTLNYARRAKVIKTAALRNEEAAQVKQLEAEVESLRQKLDQALAVAAPGEQRELEEKHRHQIQQLEAFISQSWEDKQQQSKQYEEDKRRAQEEAQRVMDQLLGEQRRRLNLLEEHGDLLLTLQSLAAVDSEHSATWRDRIAALLKQERQLHSQLRAVQLYQDAASTDFGTLKELCSRGGGDEAVSEALQGNCRAKLRSARKELDALTALELQVDEQFHLVLPEVDVAFSQACAATATAGEGDTTEVRLAREELVQLLSIVRRQLAQHHARTGSQLQAEAMSTASGEAVPDTSASSSLLPTTLGLSSRDLPDDCLGASSNAASACSARLRRTSAQGGWCPETDSADEFLEISLVAGAAQEQSGGSSSSTALVTGVSLQGRRPCSGQWQQTHGLLTMALGAGDAVLVNAQEKMFVRPAVRLVYDLSVTLVHNKLCFGEGEEGWRIPPQLLAYEEMSREEKVAFFQELIDRTSKAWSWEGSSQSEPDTGILKLLPADILSGKNCEETNRLLQLLAHLAMSGAGGRRSRDAVEPQWIMSWKLEYFVAGDGWHWYGASEGRGSSEEAVVLEGNVDADGVRFVRLPEVISASKLRIRPATWHVHPGVRCEVHTLTIDGGSLSRLEGGPPAQWGVSAGLRAGLDLGLQALDLLGLQLEEQHAAKRREGAEKEKAEEERGALEQQLQAVLARAQELEARATNAEASLLAARAENEHLGETARGLEAELKSMSTLRGAAGDKITELAKQAEELRREVDELAEQLAVVSDERDAARGQHEELFNLMSATDEELLAAHSSYVDLTQRLQEKELECEAYEGLLEEMDHLREQNDELQARLDAVSAESPERAAEVARAERTTRLEAEVARLQAANAALEEECAAAAARGDALEERKKELKSRLETSEQARKKAQGRMEALLERLPRKEGEELPASDMTIREAGEGGSVPDAESSCSSAR